MNEINKTDDQIYLSVILPCFNEEGSIHRIKDELVPELERLGLTYEIILVDDGSTDKTFETAKALDLSQLRIIRHETNKNIGAALKTGFYAAQGVACIPYDGDFTYPTKYIKFLVERFRQNDVDFVSGSPELANFGDDVPWHRQAISRFANFVYVILLGKKVTAVTHTFRIYKTNQLKELDLETDGFDIGAETLFKLIKKKRTFVEIPVSLVQRRFGESKLDFKKEIKNHIKLITRILKWRLKI